MFGFLNKFFKPDVKRQAQLRFNAASMSPDSIRNFGGTDFLSADAAMTRRVRLTIAARARNEFANNSFAYGIVFTLADDTIGTGPRLQLETFDDGNMPNMKDAPMLQKRERRFAAWCSANNINELLRTARIAKALDGEVFIVLHVNPKSGNEVKLSPRIYEAENVASDSNGLAPADFHNSGEPVDVDGITYDKYGNALKYSFHRIHPGSSPVNLEYVSYPASQVIHYANIFRPNQHRGLSEMTSALHIFNDLRRYSTAVVLAAEVAARLSFIITNNLPAEVEEYGSVVGTEDGRVVTALDSTGGPGQFTSGDFNSLVLPAGYNASQMKSEQPTQNYVSFKDSKIAEAARCFSMPFNIASGNSSSYNYASGRLDHQVYHKKLLIERGVIGQKILDPILIAWEEMDSALHPEDYRTATHAGHTWMWDGFEHVDPVKEANAQAARLANGVTSLAEECAREGRDYASILRQRQREMAECEKIGIAPLPWMNSLTGVTMAPEPQEQNK